MNLQVNFTLKQLSSTLVGCLFFLVSCNTPENNTSGTPAEFEEIESIYLSWNIDSGNGQLEAIYGQLIQYLIGEVKVNIIIKDRAKIEVIKETLANFNIPVKKISFILNSELESKWIRDSGPMFFYNEENELMNSDFFPFDFSDYTLSLEVSAREKTTPVSSSIRSFGGSREFNGKQTLILNSQVEEEINPNMSREQIAKEYQEKFHVKNIIWLNKGTILDEAFDRGPIYEDIYPLGAGGHVDEFCRFVNDSTVLLTWYDSADLTDNKIFEMDAQRMQENYNILQNAKLHDGRTITVVKIPPPPLIYHTVSIFSDGMNQRNKAYEKPLNTVQCVVPTSYLNFVIVNNTVITSTYSEFRDRRIIENEKDVKRILQEVFPNKKIKFIPTFQLNLEGGGLHCITFHKPRRRSSFKFVKHPRM